MSGRFIIKLDEMQIRFGWVIVPALGTKLMPDSKCEIKAVVGGEEKELPYENKEIRGLVNWYKK